MPIQILNNTFEYQSFGTVQNQYIANAGDEIKGVFSVRSQIRISSVNNPLTIDWSLFQVTSPSISWLAEGFRANDWVRIQVYDVNGSPLGTGYITQIVYCDATVADFTVMLPQNVNGWYDITAQEFVVIYALDWNQTVSPPVGYATPRTHGALDVLINHSSSSGAGTTLSLIDGEVSRCIFEDLTTLQQGGTQQGIMVGNQSGQFFKSCEIQRTNNINNFAYYNITVIFAQSGMYDSQWFSTNLYLKFFMRLAWASIPNDQYPRTIIDYDELANTGWFDQAHNTSPTESTLIQGISELDYCIPSVHEVIIESNTSNPIEIGIGACYVSTDISYYKNQVENQYGITMLVPTTNLAVAQNVSPTNSSGAGYTIDLNSVTQNGNQWLINFTFTPNAQFNAFMSNVQSGDRLFYIWIRDKNTNHAVFKQQLKCDPPVGGVLGLTSNYGFLDHSQNIDEIQGNASGFVANTEDDCAWYGKFKLDKNEIYDSLSAKIVAYNGNTQDEFTLQETTYSFNGIPISNTGEYLINEMQPINPVLPANSAKIDSKFIRQQILDTPTQYGVSLYYPFVLNWQYWVQQLNASVDFWPTQNANWEQYDNLPDWELRFCIQLVKDGLAFTNYNTIRDLPYDSDANIDQSIELFIDQTNQNVTVVAIGQIMRVVALHELIDGTAFNQNDTWGMITVEPTESTPRTMCSSVLPFDNDLSNPLIPLDGVQMIITYPQPNQARMECFFDPDKIDLSNGCKFTTKIKTCIAQDKAGKSTTDGIIKMTTFGVEKKQSE